MKKRKGMIDNRESEYKKKTTSLLVLFIFVLAAYVFINADDYSTAFAGFANWNTSTASVTAENVAPTMGTVTLNDDSITLVGGGTKDVFCWATITDTNGRDDILTGKGNITVFEDTSQDATCTASAYDCYRNLTFDTILNNDVCSNQSATSVLCNLSVPIYYNARNTTNWKCHMEIDDNSSASVTGDSSAATMNNLVAIDIGSATMDFGTLSPGTFSDNVTQSVYNYGNVYIDMRFNGTDMSCATGEDIVVGNLTYNVTGPILDSEWGTNLTGTLATTDFNLNSNTSAVTAPSAPTNSTYWKLYLPVSPLGARGSCSSTIWFLAIIG